MAKDQTRPVRGEPRIDATGIAEYVRLHSCERWLWYRLHPDQTVALLAARGVEAQQLSPLLARRGQEHEAAVIAERRLAGDVVVDLTGQGADATRRALAAAGERPTLLAQVRLEGTLGTIPAVGIADLVRLQAPTPGRLRLRVMDMKASREDKVEHRIQVAFYAQLLRRIVRAEGWEIDDISGAILRPDEPPSEFDLLPYEEALVLMLEPPMGVLHRMASAGMADAAYHLSYRCDGCSLSGLCAKEAAESRSLSLVPFLSQAEKRSLERAGVTTVEDLAALKVPANLRMVAAPGQEERVAILSAQWPVGASLDLHVQRARAVGRVPGRDSGAAPYLLDPPLGTLPSRESHPDLVQVYLDAQHDFVADRLYMLAALVVGPGVKRDAGSTIVEMVDRRAGMDPAAEADAEGLLIERFTRKLLATIGSAAGAATGTLHFYLYDTHDQRKLLEGLERHLERLAAIPSFLDLLTETPALSQAMVSFLAAEVRDRMNLGLLCHSLPTVATTLGYSWSEGDRRLDRIFERGMFDGDGHLADGRAFARLARFGSQIPLEYVYAAWRELPDGPVRDAIGTISPEDVVALGRARVRALAHVESVFAVKNVLLEKRALPLGRLADPGLTSAREAPAISTLLLEFLQLEHHARLQDLLLHFTLPLDRRVASGSSLLLRSEHSAAGGRCRFTIDFAGVGLDPSAGLAGMGVKEGDWVVMSPHDTRGPWDIARGRVAIVKAIEGAGLEAELLDMSFRNDAMRYPHRRDMAVVRGRLYAIDPIIDDLVGHRLYLACRNTRANDFVRLLETSAADRPTRISTGTAAECIAELIGLIAADPDSPPLTERQREVIERLSERLLLIQGPPGTGKTHTVAWAILARLWVAARRQAPMKVLVTAMTHTAVDVLLATIATLRGRLAAGLRDRGQADALADLVLFKETSDDSGNVPAGADRIGRTDVARLRGVARAVVGAVPGGVHRMLRGLVPSGTSEWQAKHWDLVVIDEASQVGVPAAVLAGAALKPRGQMLVVGDHRQMPPILSHDWDREHRRGIQEQRVYASAFEFLRDRGFPSLALDRSFRLHRTHAAFLDRHVYLADGVGFYSERDEPLAPLPEGASVHPLVAAALDPAHPVVLVQHDEAGSLRHNELEVEVIAPLVAALRDQLALDGRTGIGIVVPYRAQRTALSLEHPDLAAEGAIDTVERFQGGEREVVIVSATASDPDFVLAETSFLLNANRFNVAISRPRRKLIVIASTTLFHLTPPDVTQFEAALLWKRLRAELTVARLWSGSFAGYPVQVLGQAGAAPKARTDRGPDPL